GVACAVAMSIVLTSVVGGRSSASTDARISVVSGVPSKPASASAVVMSSSCGVSFTITSSTGAIGTSSRFTEPRSTTTTSCRGNSFSIQIRSGMDSGYGGYKSTVTIPKSYKRVLVRSTSMFSASPSVSGTSQYKCTCASTSPTLIGSRDAMSPPANSFGGGTTISSLQPHISTML